MMRRAVTAMLEPYSSLRVVGAAENGAQALEMIGQLAPDLVLLDVNMPVMGGLTALKHIMISTPLPVVMLSAMTQDGSVAAFDSLRFGAVDYIAKPSGLAAASLEEQAEQIVAKVKAAARVELGRIRYIKAVRQQGGESVSASPLEKVIVMGGAEGGCGVMLKVIPSLARQLPAAVVAVLHEPAGHVEALAHYLDGYSAFRVRPAADGDKLLPGNCYLCAGDQYVTLERGEGEELGLRLNPAPFTSLGRRGAVDMLMYSAAELLGEQAVAVIMSGLGDDGAEGLCEVRSCGGATLVQSPQNCLHPSMALKAQVRCLADDVIFDHELAQAISAQVSL